MVLNSSVVLAEDNGDDAFLFQRAFAKAEHSSTVTVCEDGEVAEGFFAKWLVACSEPLPLIAFLDIRMPNINGLEVLAWLRSHREFDRMPVILLTSSKSESDVANAGRLGAQAYFSKHLSFHEILAIMAATASFIAGDQASFKQSRNLLPQPAPASP